MAEDMGNTGLYKNIKCPNCGHTVSLTIMVFQLPSHKKKIKGLIESILPNQEYKRFEELTTMEKIVFAIGRFYDNYKRWPSEIELRIFVGLTEQTISKYVNSATSITSEQQKKDSDGRFEKKKFYLTHEGKQKYSELTYKVVGYTQDF